MSRYDGRSGRLTPHASFTLMAALLAILWIAGGASRGDVVGQVITRGTAWTILIAFILLAPRDRIVTRLRPLLPLVLFFIGTVVLVALHLVPLPPAWWTALPGRDLLAQAAVITGQEQPWRPLSISPEATANALSSLVVPAVALLLMAGLSSIERWRVATVLLGLVVASSVLALLQFSGGGFDHPLINDPPGMVGGSFANRNHFALFAAIGCLLAPAWAFREGGRSRWKVPMALALLLFFALIILASGSRMGLLVGVLGMGLGLFIVHRTIGAQVRRLPRKVVVPLAVTGVAAVATAIGLSVALNRAVSIERALALEAGQDLRSQAWPTVVAMTELYFPFGSGFGAFDPVYRIHEPEKLLGTTFLNRVHNDFLEIVLDGGLPGLLLLGAAVGWWLWQSLRAWREGGSQDPLPRLGSAVLLLVLVASTTDYPARTPMIMGVVVIAAAWLAGAGRREEDAAAGFAGPGQPAQSSRGPYT